MGLEPATDGLQNRCSTTELHRLAKRIIPALVQIVNTQNSLNNLFLHLFHITVCLLPLLGILVDRLCNISTLLFSKN